MSFLEYIDAYLDRLPSLTLDPYDRRRLSEMLSGLLDEAIESDVEWIPSPYAEDVHRMIVEVDRLEGGPADLDCPDGTAGPLRGELARKAHELHEAAARAGTVTWRLRMDAAVKAAYAEAEEAPLRARLTRVAAVATAWNAALTRRRVRLRAPRGWAE